MFNSTYLFSLILTFVNFCDNTYQTVKINVNRIINKSLDGYVIYYALYSSEDRHCAVLYDYRSFWQRLYLVFCKTVWIYVLKEDYLSSGRVFKYENVIENVDNLSSFFVDCAVVAYVQNQQVHHELLTNESNTSVLTTTTLSKFVFAILNDGTRDYDLTKWFNLYRVGILGTKQLTCIDIIHVICKVGAIDISDLSDFSLKCMSDNTFDEIVFKENDTISSKIT